MSVAGSLPAGGFPVEWDPLRLPSLHRRLIVWLLPVGVLLCTLSGLHVRHALADIGSASAVISEVMWMGSDLSTSDEWVEIACTGPADCDLSGWSLTSLKSTGEEAVIVVFSTGAVFPANAARVISNYSAVSSRLAEEPWIRTSAMSLPNTKLLLRLRDAAGAVRDEVDDGTGNPFAGANPSGGIKASMERIDLALPGNLPSNWRTATETVGFKAGPEIFGTPGALPSSSSSSVCSSSSESTSSESSESSSASAASSSSESSSESFSSSKEASSSEVSSALSASGSSLSSSEVSSQSSSSASSESSSSSQSSLTSFSSLSSLSSLSSSSLSSQSFVFITEVLANPVGVDTDEWIEVGNLGTEAVNIAGWKLDDGNSSAIYTIPPRSGAGFLLAPGEHVAFRKSVTGLPLDNTGERVSLMNGATLIDAWTYAETGEEVSFGRDPDAPQTLRPFCVPTPDAPNRVMPLDPRIVIQSGYPEGRGHVSLNLDSAVPAGSLTSAVCEWDFGDDASGTSCNPPSHTFAGIGTFVVQLTVRNVCGETARRTLAVTVRPEEDDDASDESDSGTSSSSFSCSPSVFDGITVSEFLPDPAGDETAGEWIELQNTSWKMAVLCGWKLDDGAEGSAPFSLDAVRIVPQGFVVLRRSETGLALNNGGDSVRLFGPLGFLAEDVAYEDAQEGESFALRPDGTWDRTNLLTPGETNVFPAVSSESSNSSSSGVLLMSMELLLSVERGVVVSEVQMTGDEWIELFNPLDHEVSLAGWMLDDVQDGGSKPWTFPADTVIGAGEYLLFPKSVTKLQLNDDGDDVRLVAPDGSSSEQVTVPRLKTGTTFSVVDGTWCVSVPTPGTENSCLTIGSKVSSSAAQKKTAAKSSSPLKVKYVVDLPETETGMSLVEIPEGLESLVVTGGMIEPVEPEERPSRLPELLLFTGGLMASIGMVGRSMTRGNWLRLAVAGKGKGGRKP